MPRTCTICRHTHRGEIEADLQAGSPYRDVARRHEISRHALWRHWANHIPLHNATVFATAKKVMALLDEAATSATWNANLLTVREARQCIEELLMQLRRS